MCCALVASRLWFILVCSLNMLLLSVVVFVAFFPVVAYCLLFVVCLSVVVRFLLFVVCVGGVLFVVRCLLRVGCCLWLCVGSLFVVGC